MKKIILAVVVISLAAFVSNAQTNAAPAQNPAPAPADNPNAPEIVFESENIDYGTIPYDSDGTREFKFKNTGKEPLIITMCQGSCGCTVPQCPKDPILPGKMGEIKVKYDTQRVGPIAKSVTVQSNAKSGVQTIQIKGNIAAKPVEEAFPTNAPSQGAPLEKK